MLNRRIEEQLLKTLSLAFLFFVAACSTTPEVQELTPEQVAQQERELGNHLQKELEQSIKILKDLDVSVYLRKLAERLATEDEKLRDMPIGIFLIRSSQNPFNHYAIPRGRIYLSVDHLKHLQFENEVASVLALQLIYLRDKILQERYSRLTDGDFVIEKRWVAPFVLREGVGIPIRELFLFEPSVEKGAIKEAVHLLYRAGIDPRGIVAMWKVIKNRQNGNEPNSRQNIDELIEWSYQAVSEFAPLRNPLVKTRDYTQFQARILKM